MKWINSRAHLQPVCMSIIAGDAIYVCGGKPEREQLSARRWQQKEMCHFPGCWTAFFFFFLDRRELVWMFMQQKGGMLWQKYTLQWGSLVLNEKPVCNKWGVRVDSSHFRGCQSSHTSCLRVFSYLHTPHVSYLWEGGMQTCTKTSRQEKMSRYKMVFWMVYLPTKKGL